MEQLVNNVIQWADEKGILSKDKSLAQMCKVTEEIGEVASALVKGKQEELKDGIGDSFVTLIILAKQNGLEPQECLQAAWDEIKNRKGKVNEHGAFVKEESSFGFKEEKYSVNDILSELTEDIRQEVYAEMKKQLIFDSIHFAKQNIPTKSLKWIFIFPENKKDYWHEIDNKYFVNK
jgi:NTP pyrophosphatase (non-canonical NTP hydrolase)